MGTTHRSVSRRAAGLTPGYVTVWAIAAGLALAYLGLLVIRPDVAERILPQPAIGSPESNRGQRALARALAEVKDLRQSMALLEREVADLRASVQVGDARDQALANRMAAIEEALKAMAVGAPPRVAAPVSPPLDPGATAAGPRVLGYVEERTTRILREGRTGEPPQVPNPADLPRVAATTVPLVQKPARPVGIQIASGPSVDALRLSWQLLQESQKPAIRSLEPRVVETPGDPPSYRLVAGPIATPDEAEKLCERLRQRRITCSVQPFAGKPL